MTITTRLAPIVGSMASLEALVDRIVTAGGTISSQGLPLLFREEKTYSTLLSVKEKNLDAIKKMIAMAWRHGWCEYQQSPHRGRGRPTARIAFHFLTRVKDVSASDEDIHRLYGAFLTKLEEMRNSRFFIYVSRPKSKELLVHILAHPVDLHGYPLRFENGFPERFQEVLEMVFLSDIRKVTKIWLSS